MPETKEASEAPKSVESPLVFISHDTRDAEFAEAFSKLLKSVSAGMLKSFRSSDKRGTEGIEFGDEWYKTLMAQLTRASDVVCLLTERSLERPWILYEAGVAKGKLDTPVHGLALGIPLNRVSTGPFYQFQNSDDSKESLAKLVLQLCRRVPNLEPDHEVVSAQVEAFKSSIGDALKNLQPPQDKKKNGSLNEESIARVLEEMKLMVRELAVQIDVKEREAREMYVPNRLSLRRLHPKAIDRIITEASKKPSDAVALLIITSFLRDRFPWLYELGLEAYRAMVNKNIKHALEALKQFRAISDMTLQGRFAGEFGMSGREVHPELHLMIDYYVDRCMERVLTEPTRSLAKPIRKKTASTSDES